MADRQRPLHLWASPNLGRWDADRRDRNRRMSLGNVLSLEVRVCETRGVKRASACHRSLDAAQRDRPDPRFYRLLLVVCGQRPSGPLWGMARYLSSSWGDGVNGCIFGIRELA